MEKVSLPIKTKIAAWIIIVIGGILGCLGLVGGILGLFFGGEMAGYFVLPGIGIFIGGLLIFLPGLFLLKKKRWAWWFCIIILITVLIILIEGILGEGFYLNEPPLIYLITPIVILFIISFFLLLLDKRNFWKITEGEVVEKVIIEKEVREKRGFKKIILVLLILSLIWLASGFLPSSILNPSPHLYNLALKTKNEFFCFISPIFSIYEFKDRGKCYLDLAIEKKDVNLCNKSKDFYFCVEEIAGVTKDESICEKLSWSVGCYRKVAEMKQDPTLCEKIIDSGQKDVCYRIVAEAKKDSNLCTKIIDSWERDNCYYHDFFIENDPTICGKISNEDFQKSCYKKIQTFPPPMIEEETADWKTYRSEEFGLEIKYPTGLEINEVIKGSEICFTNFSPKSLENITCDFCFYLYPSAGKKPCIGNTETEILIGGTSAQNENCCCPEPVDCPGNIMYHFGPNRDDRCIELWMVTKKSIISPEGYPGIKTGVIVPECEAIFDQILPAFRFLE